jgi:hypothetical protein
MGAMEDDHYEVVVDDDVADDALRLLGSVRSSGSTG